MVSKAGGAMVKVIRKDSCEAARLVKLSSLPGNELSVVPILAQKWGIVPGWDAVLMPKLQTLAEVMDDVAADMSSVKYRKQLLLGLNALVEVRDPCSGVCVCTCSRARSHSWFTACGVADRARVDAAPVGALRLEAGEHGV